MLYVRRDYVFGVVKTALESAGPRRRDSHLENARLRDKGSGLLPPRQDALGRHLLREFSPGI